MSETTVEPGPVQQPYVPLLITGGGERVTLRQVAEHADACNFGEHRIRAVSAAWTMSADGLKRSATA